ncbi:MAG: hypothetical protein AAF717_13260 [Bacteroidota bacterium]
MNLIELKQQYPFLYKDLLNYYPCKSDQDKYEHTDSAKFEKLNHLIDLGIGNRQNFRNIWLKGVLKKIEQETKNKVFDLTLGSVPSYGGMIRISKQKEKKIFSVDEIQFYVSLINNYISIQILQIEEETKFNKFMQQEIIVQKLLKVTVSPHENGYNHIFKKIEKVLDGLFENAKFLPYQLGKTMIDDLIIPHTYKDVIFLEEALFSKKIPLNNSFDIIGNTLYRLPDIQ